MKKLYFILALLFTFSFSEAQTVLRANPFYTPSAEVSEPSSLLTGLKAYYKLDETEGTTAVDVYADYDGTHINTPTMNGVGIKVGYDFVRANDERIDVSTELGNFGTGDFSISLWGYVVNPATANYSFCGNQDGGVSYIRAYTASTDSKLYIMFRVNSTSVYAISNAAISATTWYHIVVLVDRDGDVKLYLNTAEQTESPDISAYAAYTLSSTRLFAIGADYNSTNGNSLDGKIDEFGIWSRLLTVDEIGVLYNSGNGVTYPF